VRTVFHKCIGVVWKPLCFKGVKWEVIYEGRFVPVILGLWVKAVGHLIRCIGNEPGSYVSDTRWLSMLCGLLVGVLCKFEKNVVYLPWQGICSPGRHKCYCTSHCLIFVIFFFM